MKDYDAYVFDWDGTLARTTEIWLEELLFCAELFGLKVTKEDNARHFGNFEIWHEWGLPRDRFDDFQQTLVARVHPRLPDVALFDHALAMLQALKRSGKKLALVTSSRRSSLDIIFSKNQVGELFDVIVCLHDVTKCKPDPEGIDLALKKLGVPKARAIMLGDTDKDIQAAHNAGIDSVLFYPEEHTLVYNLEELQGHSPKYVIRSWQELLQQLQ